MYIQCRSWILAAAEQKEWVYRMQPNNHTSDNGYDDEKININEEIEMKTIVSGSRTLEIIMYSRCHCTVAAHTHVIMIYSLDTDLKSCTHALNIYLYVRPVCIASQWYHCSAVGLLSFSLSYFASSAYFLLWKNNEHELLVFNIKFNNIVCRCWILLHSWMVGWWVG